MTKTISIATTILNQIPVSLQRALGVRDVLDIGNGIQFRITGTRTVWVTVKLTAGDLYDVKAFTLRSFNETVRFEAHDVYADTLVDILDRIDRGLIVL